MTRSPARRRAAFTLLELLVVIALIALLSVIAVGAFGRIRLSTQKSATDATLNKLNSRIEQRMKAINDQVADDVKKNHPGYAAVFGTVQNVDLAKSIWTYAKMRSELPMSLAEAKNPVVINIGGVVVATIPPKAVFLALPAEPAGTNQAFDESASCLYMAVTANAGGGTATDTDGLDQQTGTTAGGAKCFKDAWGTPIAFVRTAYNAEVALPPFARAGQPFDPFDPRGKLTAFANANGNANWWVNARPNAALVTVPGTYPGPVNHTWTALSAGPDQLWGNDAYGLAAGDADLGKDNQVSYRLRREGARGD